LPRKHNPRRTGGATDPGWARQKPRPDSSEESMDLEKMGEDVPIAAQIYLKS